MNADRGRRESNGCAPVKTLIVRSSTCAVPRSNRVQVLRSRYFARSRRVVARRWEDSLRVARSLSKLRGELGVAPSP